MKKTLGSILSFMLFVTMAGCQSTAASADSKYGVLGLAVFAIIVLIYVLFVRKRKADSASAPVDPSNAPTPRPGPGKSNTGNQR